MSFDVKMKRGYPFDGTTVYETVQYVWASSLTDARKKGISFLNKYKRAIVEISELEHPRGGYREELAHGWKGEPDIIAYTKLGVYALNKNGSLGRRVRDW